jgi:hypothetical protein
MLALIGGKPRPPGSGRPAPHLQPLARSGTDHAAHGKDCPEEDGGRGDVGNRLQG